MFFHGGTAGVMKFCSSRKFYSFNLCSNTNVSFQMELNLSSQRNMIDVINGLFFMEEYIL
jgi:hypothetical protein